MLLQMVHPLQTSANGTTIHAKAATISVFHKVYPFEVYANGAPISDLRKVYPFEVYAKGTPPSDCRRKCVGRVYHNPRDRKRADGRRRGPGVYLIVYHNPRDRQRADGRRRCPGVYLILSQLLYEQLRAQSP